MDCINLIKHKKLIYSLGRAIVLFLLSISSISHEPSILPNDIHDLLDQAKEYKIGGSFEPWRILEAYAYKTKIGSKEREELVKKLIDIIKKAPAQETKQMAGRVLSVIIDEKTAQELVPLLTQRECVEAVTLAIRSIPNPEIDKYILQFLSQIDEPKTRHLLVSLLGDRSSPNIVNQLTQLARTEKTLLQPLTIALAKTGTQKAADALFELSSLYPEDFHIIEPAVIECIYRVFLKERSNQLYLLALATFKQANNPLTRLAALAIALELNPEQILEVALSEQAYPIQCYSARFVAEAVSTGKLDKNILHVIKNASPTLLSTFIEQLRYLKRDIGLELAHTMLDSTNEQLVAQAALYIASIGKAQDIEILVNKFLESKQPNLDYIQSALATSSVTELDMLLVKRLRSANPEKMLRIIELITARNLQLAIPELIKIAQDPSIEDIIRISAINAIGSIGKAQTLSTLFNLWHKEANKEVKQAIWRTFTTNLQRGLWDPSLVQAIILTYPKLTNSTIRASLIEAIGSMQKSELFGIIIGALYDQDEVVSLAALRTLSLWAEFYAIWPLISIYESHTNSLNRKIAIRGIVSLLSNPELSHPSDYIKAWQELSVKVKDVEGRRMLLSAFISYPLPQIIPLILEWLPEKELEQEVKIALEKTLPLLAQGHPYVSIYKPQQIRTATIEQLNNMFTELIKYFDHK